MAWVKNVAGFRDFLSLVIVHAPDDFPQEDYLAPDQQLTLTSAFEELQQGLKFLERSGSRGRDVGELRGLLAEALKAYEAGRDVEGAHLLQELEGKAFGGPAC